MSTTKLYTDAFYPAVRIFFNVEKLVKAPMLLRVMTITRVTTKFIVGVLQISRVLTYCPRAMMMPNTLVGDFMGSNGLATNLDVHKLYNS